MRLYPHGFFNAYEAIAARDDVDVVVHLGDYIYEYGLADYGRQSATRLGRIPSPDVECLRLEDYRLRHAQYKGEAELQAAHAAAPWIVVWDDHETADNSWTGGATNHQPDEGEWASRKRAALQAYYEWMPIREPEPGRAFEAINRAFQFGDLATLIMLETRLLARTQPFDYATQLPLERQRWNFANPAAPVALRAGEADTPSMQLLPAIYEDVGGELRPVLDWRRAQSLAASYMNLPAGFYAAPDMNVLNAAFNAPDRTMLGQAQETWLGEELARSKQSGAAWQLLGNQVLMAPLATPDLSAQAAHARRLGPGMAQLMRLTRFPFPLNPDAWDGYPQSRARVLEALRNANANTLVLSGDSHMAWANEISDAQGRVAAELGAASVTSPNSAEPLVADRFDFAASMRARNPHVKWVEPSKRGFLLLTLTKEQALAEFFAVSTIEAKQYETTRVAAFSIAPTPGAEIKPA